MVAKSCYDTPTRVRSHVSWKAQYYAGVVIVLTQAWFTKATQQAVNDIQCHDINLLHESSFTTVLQFGSHQKSSQCSSSKLNPLLLAV